MNKTQRRIMTSLIEEAWQISEDHGWHAPTIHPPERRKRDASDTERLMLIVSEAAEALECIRNGEALYWETDEGKPMGLAVELADIEIRLWDLIHHSVGEGWYLMALEKKTAYNKTRPTRHGGKTL